MSTSNRSEAAFDVVIIGAGVAGCATAMELAMRGATVASRTGTTWSVALSHYPLRQ